MFQPREPFCLLVNCLASVEVDSKQDSKALNYNIKPYFWIDEGKW